MKGSSNTPGNIEYIDARDYLCSADRPLHLNNSDSMSENSFGDALHGAFDLNDLLSDDEMDSSDDCSLGGILQKVLDIDALIGGCEEDDYDDEAFDEAFPPELDVRFDMEPEHLTRTCEPDEGPRLVNWQKRFLLLEEEERRSRMIPQLAAE